MLFGLSDRIKLVVLPPCLADENSGIHEKEDSLGVHTMFYEHMRNV